MIRDPSCQQRNRQRVVHELAQWKKEIAMKFRSGLRNLMTKFSILTLKEVSEISGHCGASMMSRTTPGE